MRIAVIGGGSWGTALGHLLAGKGLFVTMLVRDKGQALEIRRNHTNARYLPGCGLHPALLATTDAGEALSGAETAVLAVPCQHTEAVLRSLVPFIRDDLIPVCASKGIEVGTLRRMSEIVAHAWPAQAPRYAMLSGPSFAREVVEGKPSAVALACADQQLAETLRRLFATERFRVYSCPDVCGVELGGAVKNVMAIAAGVCDGLELGDNARAALITRGLAEMSRLGVALGAQAHTFMGLSGLGDLVLTCAGNLSRNRQVGLRLAAGEPLAEICAQMRMVAEGVATTESVCALADRLALELPIARAMYRVLHEGVRPAAVVDELMTRSLRQE